MPNSCPINVGERLRIIAAVPFIKKSRNPAEIASGVQTTNLVLEYLVAGFRPNGSWSYPRQAQYQRSPMEVLPKPARIRHIVVRILFAQPATVVSRWGFRVLTEVPTFPEVSGQESGLWREILGDLRRRPRMPRRVSGR